MKLLLNLFAISLLATAIIGCQSSSNEKKIGIIVPLEHKAMNEIVSGFSDTLRATTSQPIHIKVANAQGDMNLQRAIIQQMKDEHYDLIVPIATSTSQMTAAAIQHQPIVSLAAEITQKDRAQRKVCNLALVHDEISPQQLIQFIHQANPDLSRIVLIHSPYDKIFTQVAESIDSGKKYGMTIKPIMINSLNELYTVANAIPENTQAILVLKDSMIVSGISTLEKMAEKRHLALITSDQGSVEGGAGFALGVHERDIGVEGAKLAAAILAGKSACSLPITEMTKLTVFVNKSSLLKTNQSFTNLQAAAAKNHYPLELVDSTQGE